jgi:hypothetical protein
MFSFFSRPCAILFGCYLSISTLYAQSLSPGDLVVVGYNFKDPDEFSLLTLVDLPAGTQFFITDCGWNTNTSAFRPGEGLITYTVPASGIMAGQQIHYPDDPGFITQGVSGFFGLSVAGDQLLIFQGAFQAPQFLFGLTDYNGGWLSSSFTPTNQSSHLPPGLLAGHTALELDLFLQAQFECAYPFSNRTEFLTRLTNPSQWIKSTDRVVLPIMGCGFDVLSENSLQWNYKIENDQLVLFVSSHTDPSKISWWYYTPENPIALTCRELRRGMIECDFPKRDSFFFIRPCTAEQHCERYQRIDCQLGTGLIWYNMGSGALRVVLPDGKIPYHATLHLVDGTLVWNANEMEQKDIELHGLMPGFYILTVELAQVVHRIPISLIE